MKKQSKIRKLLALVLTLTMTVMMFLSLFSLAASAATFEDINKSEVFVKQQTDYTCTLAAAVMLVRRAAMMSGNSNWRAITESAMRPTAWHEGHGLWYGFTYAGITIAHIETTVNRNSLIS
ncbi:MAG: hypothetical protein IKI63_00865, partial [Clostridia bacterium]|nr:hypothetical protein [Clostridia bacterium]